MRKVLSLVLSVVMVLATAGVSPAVAKTPKLVVAGREIVTDVPPYIQNARVMVPLRAVSEAWGWRVQYIPSAKVPVQITPIITSINSQIKGVADDFGYFGLRPGESAIVFYPRIFEDEGHTVVTGSIGTERWVTRADVPCTVRQGRAFIPLRAFAEAMGCQVQWDPTTYTVSIGAYNPALVVSYHPDADHILKQDVYSASKIYGTRINDSTVNIYPTALVSGAFGCVSIPIQVEVDGILYTGTQELAVASLNEDLHKNEAPTITIHNWPKGAIKHIRVVIDPTGKMWDRDRGNNILEKDVSF